jgi:ketosteroid isomerase-like protein
MKTVYVVVDIDAPVHRVFQTLCDVEKWPEWTPTMLSVQRIDRGTFAVGSQARVVQPKLRPAVWQVSTMNADANFTWTSTLPGLRMEAGHAVESAGAGCRVSLTFAMSGAFSSIAGMMYGRLIAEYVNAEAQGLKRRCEERIAMLTDEARILALFHRWSRAVREQDFSAIRSNHDANILMFDVPPPFQSRGMDAYMATWETFYKYAEKPIAFDFTEIEVTCSLEVAFLTAIGHCVTTDAGGDREPLDFRLTMGLRKLAGEWCIVHEHHSVPAA